MTNPVIGAASKIQKSVSKIEWIRAKNVQFIFKASIGIDSGNERIIYQSSSAAILSSKI